MSTDHADDLLPRCFNYMAGNLITQQMYLSIHFFSKHPHNLEVDLHEVGKTSNTGEKVTVFFRTAFEKSHESTRLGKVPKYLVTYFLWKVFWMRPNLN